MAFKFYIDSQLTDQPENDKQLTTSIKRDSSLGALLLTQDVNLVWFGNNDPDLGTISAYSYLKSLWETGICGEAELKIYDQISDSVTYLHYTGIIKIADLKFNLQRVSLSTTVEDNSFYSYINNNKSIKVYLTSDKTKSKFNITPPAFYDIQCFDSEFGVYGNDVKMYRVYDIFEFLIGAITDNKVGFYSDFLQSTDIELFLTKGFCLINPNREPDVPIEVSFQQLFDEIKKLPISTDTPEPIAFFIDNSDPDNPILRIENESYFFDSTEVYRFADIKELLMYAETDKLYSLVRVGSDKTIDGAAPEYTFTESTSYFGFKEETFPVFGQCNNDAELNLVNNFIISSNAINSAYMGGVTDFIDDIFLIQVDTSTDQAVMHSFYGQSPPFYYNIGLNNANKLTLYSNSLQNNIGNFLGIGSDGFRSSLSVDKTYTNNPNVPGGATFIPSVFGGGYLQIPHPLFIDDITGNNFDGNNNFDPATDQYLVPADGNYSFGGELRFTIEGLQSNIWFRITYSVLHYDSTLTTVKSSAGTLHNSGSNGNFSLSLNHACVAQAGDIVIPVVTVRLYVANGGNWPPIPYYQAVKFQSISFFECNGTPEGGITLSANQSDNYRILVAEFTDSIPVNSFRNIVSNPKALYPFEKDGITRFGWIKEMKRNDQTGLTQIKLITSNAATP
jgi:hypothetical protein